MIVTCIEIEIGDVESGEEKTPEVLDLACSADGYEQYQTSVQRNRRRRRSHSPPSGTLRVAATWCTS
jgi:hypothetical protein